MGIYIGIYLIIITLSFLEVNFNKLCVGRIKLDTHKLVFWIITTILMLIGIFRHEFLGVDVKNYEVYFEQINDRSWWSILTDFRTDNGYYVLNKIIGKMTNEYWIFKSILYILTFGIVAYVIYKNSYYPAVSYLIYISLGFIDTTFCILRQALAVSICFYIFKYVKEKKLLLFIIGVLFATTIHKTAIVFLLAYPISNSNIKELSLLKKVFLFFCAIVGVRFMPMLYQLYEKMDYSELAIQGQGYSLLLYFIVIIFFITYLVKKRVGVTDIQEEYNVMFCILYFQIGATAFSLFTRMTTYFFAFFILIVPFIIQKFKRKNLLLLIFTLLFAVRFFLVLSTNSTKIIPYISIWEQI